MPMMHLLLLLLTQTAPAEQVLDRYVALHKSLPRMEIAFSANAGGFEVKGTALLDEQKRVYVGLTAPSLNYSMCATPAGIIELDKREKIYDESVGRPRVNFGKSRLTSAIDLFPTWIYNSDLRSLAPKGTRFVISASEVIGGVKCDRIVGNYDSGQISGQVDASIDPQGMPRRIHLMHKSAMGTEEMAWHFTAMREMKMSDASKFSQELPLGFVPFGLPESVGPIEVGSDFPLKGWSSSTGAADLGQKLGGKGGLIALLSTDSAPGDLSRGSLQRIRKDVPVVVVSDADHAVPGADAWDRSGQVIAKVSAPATPLFVLVDGAGKVRRLWMGYDGTKAEAFEKDVRNSFAAKE